MKYLTLFNFQQTNSRHNVRHNTFSGTVGGDFLLTVDKLVNPSNAELEVPQNRLK